MESILELVFFWTFFFTFVCTITPIPAMCCFYGAWGQKKRRPSTATKVAFAVPTTVFPVVLLALHALSSHPSWKDQGDALLFYVARGTPSWIYFMPFVAANFLVARTVIDIEYAKNTLLPPIGMVTCILICLFFGFWNLALNGWGIFPLSAGCAYAFGLYLLLKKRDLPQLRKPHFLLLAAWVISAVVTVYLNLIKTAKIFAELPDEPPQDCFIVTAASCGHRNFVGSSIDEATGTLTNTQLKTFRRFEQRFAAKTPRVHRFARSIYNTVGPLVAKNVIFRWQADIIYLLLEPLEWTIRVLRLA